MDNSLKPVIIAGMLLLIGVFFYPGWSEYVELSNDFYRFNDDVRQQIVPLICAHESLPCEGDTINGYFRSGLPKGYALVYDLSSAWLSPRTLSKNLPYLLIVITFFFACLAAKRLAGCWAALATLALCLSSYIFITRISGGLPRSFAFPLSALMIWGLVTNRRYLLAAIPVAGAAFYYPMAVLGGLVLALYLFFSAHAGRWKQRLLLLAGSGALTVLIISAGIIAMAAYQPSLGPADVPDYPETGIDGRYNTADSLAIVDANLFAQIMDSVAPALSRYPGAEPRGLSQAGGHGITFITSAVLLLLIAGWSLLAKRHSAARRLLALVAGVFTVWLSATVFLPHLLLPQRYLIYTLPLLVVVLLPASLLALSEALLNQRQKTKFLAPLLMAFVIAGLILLLGGRGPSGQGLSVSIEAGQRPLYQFIAEQEPDILVAGWPDGVVQNIPYLSGHRVLLNYEVHQVYHKPYADEMRRRANALITAYMTLSDNALQHLQKTYGVTHLIVDLRHYDEQPPVYFEPFDTFIKNLPATRQQQPLLALKNYDFAIVFRHKDFAVLDIRKLDLENH